MKSYEESIIELALCTNSAMDYADKAKVRRHNKAMTKIFSLANELKEDIPQATAVYLKLMPHSEEKVRLIVAGLSLQTHICKEEARNTLEVISATSKDVLIVRSAKRMLDTYLE